MPKSQNNSNGTSMFQGLNALSQANAKFASIAVSQMIDGTYPQDSLSGEWNYGEFGPIVQNIHQAYQNAGANGAKEARDALVRVSPELEPVFGRPESRHVWEDQVFTLADAYTPRPPLEYAVEGLFPIPSVSIVYGSPGTLKSMILVDMSACVAAGLPWLEPLPESGATGTTRQTKKVNVLWLDCDNGPRKTHERVEAIAQAHGLQEDTPFIYLSMPDPWLDVSNNEEVDELVAFLKKHDIGFLVIDNLSLISGKVEENTAAMGGVMTNLRRLSESANVAVVVIHHQRKGNGDKGKAGDQLRGHSVINASIDLGLKVERMQGASVVAIESTKTRGADVWPFHAQFVFDQKPDGELKTARFYGTTGDDISKKGVSDTAIKAAILAVVNEQHRVGSKREMKTLVQQKLPDAGVNRIGDLIDALVTENKLVKGGKTGEAHVYTLPE